MLGSPLQILQLCEICEGIFCIIRNSSTPRRTCCEVRVMLCMTQYICALLQSAGGFILEGDWTPTKTKLLQPATYRGGSLIVFQDERKHG